MTKRLGKGQGEAMMWDTVRIISDAVENDMSDKAKEQLYAKMYGALSGGHYDEDHAIDAVSKMYYVDPDGEKRHAPYWTIPQVDAVYESVKDEIAEPYNEWDFYVAFNMIAAKEWNLYKKWWPSISMEEIAEKVTDSTVNWLNDDDNPFGKRKVWGYLHSGK